MLRKIISGCQTGADRAGLDVALEHGFEVGGTMPFGYKALDGCHPEFKTKYNMEMSQSSSYVPRTKKNVEDADATIRLAHTFESPGEICTLKAINSKKKPYFDVDLNAPDLSGMVDDVVHWITTENIEVLNVAGNAEQTAAGTYEKTYQFLSQVLQKLKSPCS